MIVGDVKRNSNWMTISAKLILNTVFQCGAESVNHATRDSKFQNQMFVLLTQNIAIGCNLENVGHVQKAFILMIVLYAKLILNTVPK